MDELKRACDVVEIESLQVEEAFKKYFIENTICASSGKAKGLVRYSHTLQGLVITWKTGPQRGKLEEIQDYVALRKWLSNPSNHMFSTKNAETCVDWFLADLTLT